MRFEARKNRFKNRKKQTFPLFGAGFAVPGGPWGERKRERGTNFGRRISKKHFEIIPKMPSSSPARRCPPRWGGGLKAPKGGHRRLPNLARLLRKANAEKEGASGKRLSHMCQMVLPNVGSITKERQEAWRLHDRAWRPQN